MFAGREGDRSQRAALAWRRDALRLKEAIARYKDEYREQENGDDGGHLQRRIYEIGRARRFVCSVYAIVRGYLRGDKDCLARMCRAVAHLHDGAFWNYYEQPLLHGLWASFQIAIDDSPIDNAKAVDQVTEAFTIVFQRPSLAGKDVPFMVATGDFAWNVVDADYVLARTTFAPSRASFRKFLRTHVAFDIDMRETILLCALDAREPYDPKGLADVCPRHGNLKIPDLRDDVSWKLRSIHGLLQIPLERVPGLMEFILPFDAHERIFPLLTYYNSKLSMEDLRALTLRWEVMVRAEASHVSQSGSTVDRRLDYPLWQTKYKRIPECFLPPLSSPMILFPPLAKQLEGRYSLRSLTAARKKFRKETMVLLERKYAQVVFAAGTSARLREQRRRKPFSFDERCDVADMIFASESFAHRDALFVAQLLSPQKEVGDLLYEDFVSELREKLRKKMKPQALDHMLALY
ncbi:Hypothetical Protein FCC1311_058222 [Hondaea fermentalgiana]|uniref:Uncharacterized protein n=1 Tax=Hondaea fermentalgiana TaxID=2315210 RepID=A0A2R5GMR5_9STRA|nr:Hypothetical Protein FCC1311_058222 [Hondaea fermentalgiana]|eukprot:GBG29601.1 Hypothetical Protein FCC1311_058222 [Hondaea fermentalgiana]